jgi:hypothetical protein
LVPLEALLCSIVASQQAVGEVGLTQSPHAQQMLGLGLGLGPQSLPLQRSAQQLVELFRIPRYFCGTVQPAGGHQRNNMCMSAWV